MPTPHCFGVVQARLIRVAQLTQAGLPIAAPEGGYRTNAVIDVGVTVEVEVGEEQIQRNGSGDLCQVFKDRDRVKRVGLTMNLCQLDSELIQLLVGGTVIQDGSGDTIGYQLPLEDDAEPNPTSFELWATAWDGTSQAVLAGTAQYFHFVFPFTRWSPGAFTVNNQLLTVPLTGFSTPNDVMPDDGPFDDWPADVESAGGITSSGGWFLDPTLPETNCGYIAVPAAS